MLLYFAPCSNPGAGGDTATGVAVWRYSNGGCCISSTARGGRCTLLRAATRGCWLLHGGVAERRKRKRRMRMGGSRARVAGTD